MRLGEGEESSTLTENIYLMATLRSLLVHSQMMNMWSSLMDKQCQIQGFEKGGGGGGGTKMNTECLCAMVKPNPC